MVELLLGFFLIGAGPILVDTDLKGTPVGWKGRAIHYNVETGSEATLGRLSNEEAVNLVRTLFSEWQQVQIDGVSVVDFDVEEGSGLGSVTADNLNQIFSYCPPLEDCPAEDPPFVSGSLGSGQSPILFDHDGSLTDLILGEGSKRNILGFAGPRAAERVGETLFITEGQAVLNGLFIDCPEGAAAEDPCQDPEVSLGEFSGAIFHEIGHFIGLDHTQVNLKSAVKALSGDLSEIDGVPTMLPLLVDGVAQRSPHLDDIISLAILYPSAEYSSRFCTLKGTVYQSDSQTELQGVNVVLQNPEDPLKQATSYVSGQLFVGSSEGCLAAAGDFEIGGLTPGISYQLAIEKINSSFRGGSSIEPCDPPQSGFQEKSVEGTFSCEEGGGVITVGTLATTRIITTKGQTEATDTTSDGGGCSLIP